MITLFVWLLLQEDVFELVGVPLVKDALAGYNASILSYGQVTSKFSKFVALFSIIFGDRNDDSVNRVA